MNLEIGYDLDALFFDLSYDIKLNFPDANADTEILWGDVASGTVYYYFTDTDGVRHIKSSYFYFNTGDVPGNVSNGTVSFFAVRQGSGTAPVSISFASNSITLNSGGLWNFKTDFLPYEHLSSDDYTGTDKLVIYTTAGINYVEFNENRTYNSYNTQITLGTTDDNKTPFKYTTSPSAHEHYPNVPYIPVSGRNMSYNDMRQYVVNQYNEQNPSETINVNDLPAFDDSPDPTEYQPFSLDYNEILGERELESILKETQYILDTTPVESIDFSFPETLPEASAPDAGIVSTVGKIFEMHKNIVPPELVTIWGGLAVFAVLFWWITK